MLCVEVFSGDRGGTVDSAGVLMVAHDLANLTIQEMLCTFAVPAGERLMKCVPSNFLRRLENSTLFQASIKWYFVVC
jgi:hypothetical protein